MAESVTSTEYCDNRIRSRSVSQVDRAAVARLCGVCHSATVHAKGRCMACYQSVRRNGTDRPMARLHDKRKPTVVPRREEPDEDTVTYAEWCASRGFDPKTKRYRPS